MIKNNDRSFYFGASDTSFIVGNWETKTFEKWWLEKLGFRKNELKTEAIMAGNNYEHKILNALKIQGLEKDKQIIIDRLRVNLDGNTENCIYEVKTYNLNKEFKISKQYWRQAQVEMYASKIKKLYIVAYGLTGNDYVNYFSDIDTNRIVKFEIKYEESFIINEYLPKLNYLIKCLKKGEYPKKDKLCEVDE